MEINQSKTRLWSKLGSRATFGLALLEISKEADNLMVVTGDVSTSAGLDRYRKTFPDKFVDVGIAEQNMIGVAAGLSFIGYKVFTTTFSPFQTLRCCEQIKVNLGYMQHNVCMVGLASGVALGELGYTHCSIEDIAVMRSFPNITVISPADCTEVVKVTQAVMQYDKPVYIRLTGEANNRLVFANDYEYEIGNSILVREGNEISIVTCGTMVRMSLDAAEVLQIEHGISVEVINMHTIKPLDTKILENTYRSKKLIVTVEEHSCIGGLGGAVAEHKCEYSAPPQLKLGLNDRYGPSGKYEAILESNNLSVNGIVNSILKRLKTLN